MGVKLKDNSGEILDKSEEAKFAALEAIGMKAEKYAKRELTNFPAVDTGRLRNSITHAIEEDEDAVYIGTNVEYGKWIELGTGIYASDGQGKKEPWVYQDDEGNYHLTRGVRPVHFLKKAATEHSDEYKEINKRIFENA